MSLSLFGQKSPCVQTTTGSYWPLNVGIKQELSGWSNYSSEIHEIDSIVRINNKSYYRVLKSYSNGKTSFAYFRKTDDSSIVAYDLNTNSESIQLKDKPFINQEWYDSDSSWQFKVYSLNSIYTTPFCEFDSLLELRCYPTPKNKDGVNYKYCSIMYKKGIGLVGVLIEKNGYTYLKTDNADFISYPYIKKCNFNDFERRNECTVKLLTKTFSKLKYSNEVKGKIFISLLINAKGKVENIQYLKSDFESNLIKDDIEPELLKLRFIPGREYGIPVKKEFAFPVVF